MKENELRDSIVLQLRKFDSNLKYLDKEKYIPNNLGTRGFIDILCKDSNNNFVIVEVKKSDNTSREALHEVIKYYEGVKSHIKAKSDEIKLVIMSTTWRELLVPFSSFFNNSIFDIKGYIFQVNEKTLSISNVQEITPLDMKNERYFCNRHTARFYKSRESFQRGIKSHTEIYKKRGINDYVLITFKSSDDRYEKELNAMKKSLISSGLTVKQAEDSIAKHTDYKFMIYCAVQLYTEEFYRNLLSENEELLAEVDEFIDDFQGEDRLAEYHEYAIDSMEPRVHRDYLMIGYPARIKSYIYEDDWELIEILRSDTLKNNPVLEDECILEELISSDGSSLQSYKKEFYLGDTMKFNIAKRDIDACLKDNSMWRIPVKVVWEEVEKLYRSDETKITIQIYNPMHIIYSIYLMATSGKDPITYLPSLFITLFVDGLPQVMYMGYLEAQNTSVLPNLKRTLKECYEEAHSEIAFSLTYGGYNHDDTSVVDSLGLAYTLAKVRFEEDQKEYFVFKNYEFKLIENPLNPIEPFFEFLMNNQNLVDEIIAFFNDEMKDRSITIF